MKEKYYLVREDILPEAVLKTMRVKELLASGDTRTINEAVEKVGLSRSAFYKYKDGIHPLNRLEKDRIITVSFDLDHRSGILSHVLGLMAEYGGNVLTIHQSIPLQGRANVVLSVETTRLTQDLDVMIEDMQNVPGVRHIHIIGQG
ncbi:ACT domain-containing protein [Paenibacillus sp. WLX1005]|uniref:ACT domain-containing protein n=1 Tax=Paenibacillus TaxID=44249 RepID=UPI003457579D